MRRGGGPHGAGLLHPPMQADSQDPVQLLLALFLDPAKHGGLVFGFLQFFNFCPEQVFDVHDAEFLQYARGTFGQPHSWHCHKVLF